LFLPRFAPLGLALLSTAALADQPAGGPPPGAMQGPPSSAGGGRPGPSDRITIGIGGGIAPDYSGSNDYEFQPGGVIQGSVSGFDFAMRGLNLYVDLARERPGAATDVVFGPVAQLRLDRTGTVKDARVAALGERATAVELGGYAGIGKRGVFSRFSADVAVLHDVGGGHGSTVITPSIGYSTLLGSRTFTVARISADIVGAGFASAYYDVPAGSAPTPYSTGGGGLESVGASVLATHDLSGDPRTGLSLFALTGYSRILGKFARSPVVAVAGNADQFRLIAGVGYTF
jgi:outer membrane protein